MTQTILLVDDEPKLLQSLARSLRGQPYEVVTARSGEEALQILKSHHVDLIVSDERMPGMQGSELVTWVATHLPDVTRIILTGQASIPAAMRAINDGRIYRFLTKPITAVDLAMTITTALQERASVSEEREILRCTQMLLYEADAERQRWEREARRTTEPSSGAP